jgi:hypothetical protein
MTRNVSVKYPILKGEFQNGDGEATLVKKSNNAGFGM